MSKKRSNLVDGLIGGRYVFSVGRTRRGNVTIHSLRTGQRMYLRADEVDSLLTGLWNLFPSLKKPKIIEVKP